MDGADGVIVETYKYTRFTNCPCMAIDQPNLSISITFRELSGIYRVDTFDLDGQNYRFAYLAERKYLPSHMYMLEGGLIWAGRPSHSTGLSTRATDVIRTGRLEHVGTQFVYKDYISRKFRNVTGLTHYGFSPKWMRSSLKERARESHLCKGVPLLSEIGSSHCACPTGTRAAVDGSSCKSKFSF